MTSSLLRHGLAHIALVLLSLLGWASNANAQITINEDANQSINENSTTVATLSASTSGSFVGWVIAGGTDSDLFELSAETGSSSDLRFKLAPDFEDDQSTGQSNVYVVTIQAFTVVSGSFRSTNKTFQITVNNVNEAPTDISITSTVVVENGGPGAIIGTLTGSDPDAGDSESLIFTDNHSDLDVVDGNLVVIANPDFETNPSYSVTITASDGALTYSETYSITVTDLVDNTLEVVSLTTSNTQTGLARQGDVITLVMRETIPLSIPSVTLAGGTPSPTKAGSQWTAQYTVTPSDSEGSVDFDVTYTSAAGAAQHPIDETFTTDQVVIDLTSPTISNTSITSDNSTSTLATVGDVITLTFQTSESVTLPTVTIAGRSATVTSVSGQSSWRATYTVESTTPQGVANISISASDLAGNTSTSTTITSRSVTIDRTAPTGYSVSFDPTEINESNLTTADFTISAAETGATLTYQITDGVTTINRTESVTSATQTFRLPNLTTLADGTLTLTAQLTDPTGNTGSDASATIQKDATRPSLESVSIISNNATSTNKVRNGETVTLTFRSSETLTATTVTIGGVSVTPTTADNLNYTASRTINASDAEDQAVGFTIDFTDTFSNSGTRVTATTDGSTVTVDRVAPTLSPVTIASNHSNSSFARVTSAINLNFTSNEDLSAASALIDGSSATMEGTGRSRTATYTVSSSSNSGPVSFSATATDMAGNTATTSTTTNGSSVTIDKTAPGIISLSISSSNDDPLIAIPDDIITLTLIANEVLVTPTLRIAGESVTMTTSDNLTWTGTLTVDNQTEEGDASISLTIADRAGNQTSRTSTIDGSSVEIDVTRPTLTPVSITSNNVNSAFAKVGNLVTLTATSSEALDQLTGSIAGTSVTMTSADNLTWTGSLTVTSTTTEGEAPIQLIPVDLFGNTGTTVNATTDGSSVTIDRTAPTYTTVSLSSNNGPPSSDPTRAKSGDIITLSFTANEAIQTPTASLPTGSSLSMTSGDNITWTGTRTVTNSTAETSTIFSIAITDLAGNTASTRTTTTDGSSVTVDRTAPTFSAITIRSDNADPTRATEDDRITFSITASERLLSPVQATIGNRTLTLSTTDNATYTGSFLVTDNDTEGLLDTELTVYDLTGNATTANQTTDQSQVTIDLSPPGLTSLTLVSNNEFNTAYAKDEDILTLTAVFDEEVTTITATLNGTPLTLLSEDNLTWSGTRAVTDASTEGIATFTVRATDETGNQTSTITNTTDGKTVTIDLTPPTLTTVSIASNNADPTQAKAGNQITLTATANERLQTPTLTLSGLSTTMTSANQTSWTGTFTVGASTPEGPVSITLDVMDLAGNGIPQTTRTTDATSVNVDRTKPEITLFTIRSDNATRTLAKADDRVTVTAEISETVSEFTVSLSGLNVQMTSADSISWTGSLRITENTPEGEMTIRAVATDPADNASSTLSATTDQSFVIVDVTAPTGYEVTILQEIVDQEVLDFEISNAELETTYEYAITDEPGTGSIDGDGTVTQETFAFRNINVSSLTEGLLTVGVTLTDEAGNIGPLVQDTVQLDLSPAIIYGPNGAIDTESNILTPENQLSVFRFSANKPVTWEVLENQYNSEDAGYFTINSETGALAFATNPDYENPDHQPSYFVTIQATNRSGKLSQQTLTVRLSDVNENPTEIRLNRTTFPENEPIGTFITKLLTTDPDIGDRHTYSIPDDYLEIRNDSLFSNAVFNYEEQSELQFVITTTDLGNLIHSELLTLTIEDRNDPPSAIELYMEDSTGTLSPVDQLLIEEDAEIGTRFATLVVIDEDEGDSHTIAFDGNPATQDSLLSEILLQFIGDVQSPEYNLSTTTTFDFETKNRFDLLATIVDEAFDTLKTPVVLRIGNVYEVEVPLTPTLYSNPTNPQNVQVDWDWSGIAKLSHFLIISERIGDVPDSLAEGVSQPGKQLAAGSIASLPTDTTRVDYPSTESIITLPYKGLYEVSVIAVDTAGIRSLPSEPGLFALDFPEETLVFQNYPNPFSDRTTFTFFLAYTTKVKVKIYTMLGQEVETLVDQQLRDGYHEYVWDASNVASGIYLVHISTATEQKMQQVTVIR